MLADKIEAKNLKELILSIPAPSPSVESKTLEKYYLLPNLRKDEEFQSFPRPHTLPHTDAPPASGSRPVYSHERAFYRNNLPPQKETGWGRWFLLAILEVMLKNFRK